MFFGSFLLYMCSTITDVKRTVLVLLVKPIHVCGQRQVIYYTFLARFSSFLFASNFESSQQSFLLRFVYFKVFFSQLLFC